MAKLHKTTTIDEAAQKVFKILEDPNNMKLYVPAVTQVSDVKQSDRRIGDTWRITYTLMGIHFDQLFTRTEHSPNKRLAAKFEGGMNGSLSFTLEPEADSTKVSFDVDYQISGGVLGKAADKLLMERMNEKNSERMLENLKMMIESAKLQVSA